MLPYTIKITFHMEFSLKVNSKIKVVNMKRPLFLFILMFLLLLIVNFTTPAKTLIGKGHSSINLTKITSEIEIHVEDELIVSIIIENNGEDAIHNLILKDSKPAEFDLVNGSLTANWTVLEGHESLIHEYRLLAKEKGKFTLEKANVTYAKGEVVESNEVEIRVREKTWKPPEGTIEATLPIFLGVYILPICGIIIGFVLTKLRS